MTTRSRNYPNLYKDSVSLMTVSAKVMAVPGIDMASVVMASATNVDNLAEAGLGTFEVRPNDLVVAVSGDEAACAEALQKADELLSAKAARRRGRRPAPRASPSPASRWRSADDPAHNFALISVPGDYAAAEAMKALRLGMDVMLFSDNVPPESELALKTYAREHDLMVMGPDCGTAIVNGVPLGFANVVRRGPIGVVGASGTGTQEVTVRIHQLGSGVSQALGTGGHDLSKLIGGISMLHGLAALDADPATKRHRPGLEAAGAGGGGKGAGRGRGQRQAGRRDLPRRRSRVDHPQRRVRRRLSGAGRRHGRRARQGRQAARRRDRDRRARCAARSSEQARAMAPGQRYVRGIFSGGTFCFEAQLIHAAAGISAFSNTPTAGNAPLPAARQEPGEHDHRHGRRRVHPGPPAPDDRPVAARRRIRDEVADPTTAVVLFDVVLGYGSAADPIAGLLGVIGSARAKAKAAGRHGRVHRLRLRHRPATRRTAARSWLGSKSAGVLVAVVQRRGRRRGPPPSSPSAREPRR